MFILGAMSPGPSLAVVLHNTMVGGRRQGVMTGIGHGLGFGLYAFLAAVGMATALALHEATQAVLKWGGIALLVYLGARFLQAARANFHRAPDASHHGSPGPGRAGFAQGFAVALLNPKILAWMLAIYAPFIKADAPMRTSLAMSLVATCTDASWYITVAAMLSGTGAIRALRARAHIVHGAMGALMLLFAALLAGGVL